MKKKKTTALARSRKTTTDTTKGATMTDIKKPPPPNDPATFRLPDGSNGGMRWLGSSDEDAKEWEEWVCGGLPDDFDFAAEFTGFYSPAAMKRTPKKSPAQPTPAAPSSDSSAPSPKRSRRPSRRR